MKMTKNIIFLHPHGASMIQALVAVALFAAMFLGTVNLMREQAKTSQSSSREFEMVYVTDEIKSLLSEARICKATLQGRNPHSDQIETLKRPLDSDSEGLLEVYPTIKRDSDAVYGQKNLKIKSYRLSDKTSEVNVEAGTTELLITYATSKQTIINQKRRLRLYIGLDEQGLIASCQTTPGLTQTSLEEGPPQGPWTLSVGREAHFSDLNLVLGATEKELSKTPTLDSGVDQFSGLLLLSEHAKKPCTSLLEGSLRFHANSRQVQICSHESKWEGLATYQFNPLEAKIFSLSSKSKAPLDIHNRSYCSLLKTDVSSGQCSLTQKDNQWQLHAIGENTKCQSVCY